MSRDINKVHLPFQKDGVMASQGIGSFHPNPLAIQKWQEDKKMMGMHSVQDGARVQSVEVFHCPNHYALTTDDPTPVQMAPGWYWWPCQPGCLPDAEPLGPFANSAAALANAVEEYA